MNTSSPKKLESYLSGRWSSGQGIETELVNPVTGETLATASAKGLDLRDALAFARTRGQAALRSLGYGERAQDAGRGGRCAGGQSRAL